jgi:hypothetical protein
VSRITGSRARSRVRANAVQSSFRHLPFVRDRLRADVKTLCRLVCNSFDARAVRVRLTRVGSNHKFNLVVLSPRYRPMRLGAADCSQTWRSCRSYCARPSSIWIALLDTGRRTGQYLVCAVLYAEPSLADSGQALLKSSERANHNTVPIYPAPRIVLGLGAISNAEDTDANSQHKQREPHGGLLVAPDI